MMVVMNNADDAGAVALRLSSAEQWRSYLAEYSADLLRVSDPDDLPDVGDDQRAAGWLGYPGATEEQLAALERRLGACLPPSYRAFLATSNGWLHLSEFMWTMRNTESVGWFRDADVEAWEVIRGGGDYEWDETELMDRVLLVSGDGDAQYWLLDPGDVGPDGEWAAYIWASWYPGLGDRCPSFAALVDDERESFEHLSGTNGRPVHPDGAAELVAEGRMQALRGEVDAAAATFERAAVKGSGAGAYLGVIVAAFLDATHIHHTIRNNILAHRHVMEAIGREQVDAEVVPLFVHRETHHLHLRDLLGDRLPPLSEPSGDERADWQARAIAFVPPRLPESPAFQGALDRARDLAVTGARDEAWAVIEAALPLWDSDSPYRIAPVILLTDPVVRELMTPERSRLVITTPRGAGRRASR
jgi:hypothetical protein